MTNLYQFFQMEPNSGWDPPELLGSDLGGYQVCVATNSDNRMEVFFIDENFQVSHVFQTSAVPASGSFAGVQEFGIKAKQIAAGRNADGRLEFFYIDTNNNLGHCWESAPSSGPWQSEPFSGQAKQIALTNDSEGRLQLFYIGMDDYIYTNWQTSPSVNNWDWTTIQFRSQKLTVAKDVNGCLQLVVTALWVPGEPPIGAGLYSFKQAAPASSTWSPGVGLADFAKDLTFAQHADGSLELFFIGTNHGIYSKALTASGWQPTQAIGGLAQQLSICRDVDGRFELFYVGMDGYVYHLWQEQVNGPFSGGGGRTGYLASYLANTTDSNGQIVLFFLGYLTAPADALPGITPAGNDNYIFYNNGRPLFSPQVTFTLNSELDTGTSVVAKPGDTLHNGFSLQFNSYSPLGGVMAWQQYIIEFDGATFSGWINNWTQADLDNFPKQGPSINSNLALITTLSTGKDTSGFQKIPANYQLQILLNTDDSNGNVMGATCTVLNDKGQTLGTPAYMDLSKQNGYKDGDLTPIVAFEVNLVATMNTETLTFTAGSGTFAFSSPTALTPLAVLPPCAAAQGTGTGEQSNTSYGALTSTPQIVTSQSVSVVTGTNELRALIQRTRQNPPRKRIGHHPPANQAVSPEVVTV